MLNQLLAVRDKSPVGLTRGSCEVRSRREEEAMRCHRRRRAAQSEIAIPSCPMGYERFEPIFGTGAPQRWQGIDLSRRHHI